MSARGGGRLKFSSNRFWTTDLLLFSVIFVRVFIREMIDSIRKKTVTGYQDRHFRNAQELKEAKMPLTICSCALRNLEYIVQL